MTGSYDIVIVGGGHAGVEAAWMASTLGANSALITMSHEAIARMSCNPAIGGLGKGQIVREIDALGGLMGLAIDEAGIQFRMLNRSKGPAVWAPRAQADRDDYARSVQSLVSRAQNLDIIEGLAETIHTTETGSQGKPRISSIELRDGRVLRTDAIILTTGTFLRALMHCGSVKTDGGRVGEESAEGLSGTLKNLGFTLGRLKTGTPPRIDRETVDFDQCTRQPGDEIPTPFSAMTDAITQRQVDCWITWTNERTHDFIRSNLHRAPMYSGQIESTGPRYCPSIEDKIVRFSDKSRHQIFLEPEGYDDRRIYCNGISTSLPRDVQDAFVHSVPGLERASILQYGYAVEYDFVPTDQVQVSLETKRVRGLFLAGQINGTSGYEEAAGQGLIAGINAARMLRGEEPFVLKRDEAYIGVMIDDLVTRPPTEPYRMFTSRAEYRLQLRADNADDRLTPMGRQLGTVDDQRWRRFQSRAAQLSAIRKRCEKGHVDAVPLQNWMRRPDADVTRLSQAIGPNGTSPFCAESLGQVLIEARYGGYIERQSQQVERFRRLEDMALPGRIDYEAIAELRAEARENLTRVAPRTLGQASRISGVNPADLTVLWVYLSGRRAIPQKTID